jgi:hypothetical protein
MIRNAVDIDERVKAMFIREFRREYAITANWEQYEPGVGEAYRLKWLDYIGNDHHLAACNEIYVHDCNDETQGGCAEGTCDTWVRYKVRFRCPHGSRSSFYYDGEHMWEMIDELVKEDEEQA